ncbi:MAG: DUF4352 domain-containing protein [Enterococcus lacertideformus]|uniref:DUF4352 domain-containing protein n=1 Tax=Enterococcus lacertideformus TaxID=2771493 RepID=A0A931AVV2_9ENTE|nr:DUF4352 domain-containing protein [Enterococcus lacertideformus]
MDKKKIIGKDGKTYVMKKQKPFYKRIWFWIVAVIIVFAITDGSLGRNDEKASTTNAEKKVGASAKNETTESTDTLDKDFKVGDIVSYKGYEIKVNNVQYNDGTEYNRPKEGQQFVIVNITITNNTSEKQTYNPFDYKLNANGNATDLMSFLPDVDNLNSGELDPKASVTGNLIGEADTSGSLKLQYKASYWNDKTVDINLK